MKPVIVNQFSDAIKSALVREDKVKTAAHEPSGKISASMMGTPVLECVLKLLGVPGKEFDAFTIGKFARGNQAEDWFVEHIQKAMPDSTFEAQKEIEYRGGIGFVDLAEYDEVANREMAFIPHEVKSVSNRAFKWIADGEWYTGADGRKHKADPAPNTGHINQATFYGLAMGSPYFFIHYVAADDLRVLSFKCETAVATPHVESHITAIQNALKEGKLPDWVGFLKYHGMKLKGEYAYTSYPEFCEMTSVQAEALLKERYPAAYVKLKDGQ